MSIKYKLIESLEKTAFFYHLKYNTILYKFLLAIRTNLRKSIQNETILYSSLLKRMPKNAIIFDIGASVGTTTSIFKTLGAQVIAIEPSPKNHLCLSSRFRNTPKVKVVNKAVSNNIGKALLYEQKEGNTLHTLSQKWKQNLNNNNTNRWNNTVEFYMPIEIITTTLDELIKDFGLPYLIKIDVEGFEWEVIQGLSQSVSIISFEANLPEFLEETILCVKRLIQIGQGAVFNYSTGESVVLEEPLKEEAFISFLKETPLRYLDIICYT